MVCPHCGSSNCQYITTSETHSKGFDSGDACCGLFLLGPAGLLCGLCGSESHTNTKEFWVCQNCGRKFSGSEAVQYKRLEEKSAENYTSVAGNTSKFQFYSINEGTEEDKRMWQKTQTGIYEEFRGTDLINTIFTKEPTEKNDILEEIKGTFAKVVSGWIFCVISDGDSIIVSNEGIIVIDHLIQYKDIRSVYLYQTCVYVNQTSIRVKSEENAKKLFGFISVVIGYDNKTVRQQFLSYEDLLEALLKTGAEISRNSTHFSSQEEYLECLKVLEKDYFNQLNKSNPLKYERYIQEKNHKDKIYEICGKPRKIVTVIIVILCTVIMGWIGLLLSIIFIAVLPSFILKKIFVSKWWYGYREEYLGKEMFSLLEEIERQKLKRRGSISPKLYRKIINDLGTVQKDNEKWFCSNCGKRIEKTWSCCPYCGTDNIVEIRQ